MCNALPPRGSGQNEVAVCVELRNSEIVEGKTSKLLYFWPPLYCRDRHGNSRESHMIGTVPQLVPAAS